MLPNLSDYMQTFQNPQFFLTDKALAKLKCPQDQQGQPLVQSGGFALTFRLEGAGEKWAVRCFHREVADRDKRYTIISNTLGGASLKHSGYFVTFEYQSEGVVVKGKKYPIVKMAWAKGETLGVFLEGNYNNRTALQNLRTSLQRLRKFLSDNHIAHGDIQPGNIMVSNAGRDIQLIDYDGMFVPGMESFRASETGVPNFQHPGRQQKCPWNEKLDRFPFIILDIALCVLVDNPAYWTKTNSSDEKILFETTDYLAPLGSALFNELKRNPRYSQQISALQQICLSDFDAIPSADGYIGFKAVQTTGEAVTQSQTITISYKGNYPVVSATDIASVKTHVGDVVEIVGRIYNTKDGISRKHKPYCFVNFTGWLPGSTTFRLVLWSKILDQFTQMGIGDISGRFSGQFISITGLVVEFTNKWGTSYQIVPQQAKSLLIISSAEADFRLGKTKKTIKQQHVGTLAPTNQSQGITHQATTTNVDKLRNNTGGKSNAIPQNPPMAVKSPNIKAQRKINPSPTTSTAMSNVERLRQMSQGKQQPNVASAPQSYQYTKPTNSITNNIPQPKPSQGCLVPLVAFIASILALGAAIAATIF